MVLDPMAFLGILARKFLSNKFVKANSTYFKLDGRVFMSHEYMMDPLLASMHCPPLRR